MYKQDTINIHLLSVVYLSIFIANGIISLIDPEVDAAATMLTLKNGPNVTVQSI